MADTTVMTNEIYEKVMEGVSPEVRGVVEDGLRAWTKDPATNPSFTDKVKCEKLRKAFESLCRTLLERQPETLNPSQQLFINTGALADEVELAARPGEEPVVAKLLARAFYDKLAEAFGHVAELPEEMDYVLTTVDRARLIAMMDLYALDPQASGKRRPAMAAKKDGDVKQQREMALSRRNALVKELEEALPQVERLFGKYLVGNKMAAKEAIDSMRKFHSQAIGKDAPLEGDAKATLERKLMTAGQVLGTFAEDNAQTLVQIKDLAAQLGPKSIELRKTLYDMDALNAVATDNMRTKYVSYDAEKVSLIKRDVEYTAAFVGKAAESSGMRVATSGSRVLLDSHLDYEADPLKEQICTPENVHAAMQKILSVHTNLFPLSAAGKPIIPRIVIEPVRNVVEWLDDRFLVSLVSGEPARKGPNLSLTPVDLEVFRACGMYLSRDSMFNYRGEQNVGTFMGDYSGKVEKQAKVVFAGADKKMTMVASSAVLDQAGRDQAVTDYIDFIFNVKNGLTPNPKMSKRRIAILLRYCIVDDLETTVILLLRFAGMAELGECRETILKLTQNKYDDAKRLVEGSWKDPNIPKILGEKPTQYMAKMFG
jgi:hypothetical protein